MSGPRHFRLLSAEEIELWRGVAHTVVPRPGSSLPPIVSLPVQAIVSHPAPLAAKPAKLRPMSVVASYAPPQSKPRAPGTPPLVALERLYRKQVARGAIGIERVMDLHGLNQAEAHGALRGFLRTAHAEDIRLVLIITGKGQRTDPARVDSEAGVLRRSVPHWLREYDLRGMVLGFEEASHTHGGAGALYVRLRQRRG